MGVFQNMMYGAGIAAGKHADERRSIRAENQSSRNRLNERMGALSFAESLRVNSKDYKAGLERDAAATEASLATTSLAKQRGEHEQLTWEEKEKQRDFNEQQGRGRVTDEEWKAQQERNQRKATRDAQHLRGVAADDRGKRELKLKEDEAAYQRTVRGVPEDVEDRLKAWMPTKPDSNNIDQMRAWVKQGFAAGLRVEHSPTYKEAVGDLKRAEAAVIRRLQDEAKNLRATMAHPTAYNQDNRARDTKRLEAIEAMLPQLTSPPGEEDPKLGKPQLASYEKPLGIEAFTEVEERAPLGMETAAAAQDATANLTAVDRSFINANRLEPAAVKAVAAKLAEWNKTYGVAAGGKKDKTFQEAWNEMGAGGSQNAVGDPAAAQGILEGADTQAPMPEPTSGPMLGAEPGESTPVEQLGAPVSPPSQGPMLGAGQGESVPVGEEKVASVVEQIEAQLESGEINKNQVLRMLREAGVGHREANRLANEIIDRVFAPRQARIQAESDARRSQYQRPRQGHIR